MEWYRLKRNDTVIKCTIIIAVLLNGCAMQSTLIDTENERGGFVVTKPPIQVTYRGDISEIQHRHMLDVIDRVKTIPFRDYKFNTDHNVRLNSIDGKADNIDIKLHETTRTPEEQSTTEVSDGVTDGVTVNVGRGSNAEQY